MSFSVKAELLSSLYIPYVDRIFFHSSGRRRGFCLSDRASPEIIKELSSPKITAAIVIAAANKPPFRYPLLMQPVSPAFHQIIIRGDSSALCVHNALSPRQSIPHFAERRTGVRTVIRKTVYFNAAHSKVFQLNQTFIQYR